ncbi:hypothetical protein ILYODFUR_030505 [Ilyodon furcidens]|uniref:Uncharacterized protein n=1 Tax=Ilyodon furcidens TaxID=33524 RepID=A0ABV0VII0_9TELE
MLAGLVNYTLDLADYLLPGARKTLISCNCIRQYQSEQRSRSEIKEADVTPLKHRNINPSFKQDLVLWSPLWNPNKMTHSGVERACSLQLLRHEIFKLAPTQSEISSLTLDCVVVVDSMLHHLVQSLFSRTVADWDTSLTALHHHCCVIT